MTSLKMKRTRPKGEHKVTLIAAGTVLLPSTGEFMSAIASDPAKARAFLQKNGFITKSGRLARKYA